MNLFLTFSRRRNWYIAITTAVIAAIILAIIVPLAVLVPEKRGSGQRSSVLLPLYIYPETNSSWNPLFDA